MCVRFDYHHVRNDSCLPTQYLTAIFCLQYLLLLFSLSMWVARKYSVTHLLICRHIYFLNNPTASYQTELQHGNECHITYPNHFFLLLKLFTREERGIESTKD